MRLICSGVIFVVFFVSSLGFAKVEYHLVEAVVHSLLNMTSSNGECSASLVRPTGVKHSRKALVLTSGRCVNAGAFTYEGASFLANGEKLKNLKKLTKFTTATGIELVSNKIIFATMTDLDIAIFEVEKTYVELEKMDLLPLEISSIERTPQKTELGYASLRQYQNNICNVVNDRIDVREGPWDWTSMVGLSGSECRVAVRGVEGAAVLDSSGKVVGVVGSKAGEENNCSVDNPCERNGSVGNSTQKVYATKTAFLSGCVNNGEFTVKSSSCMLK